MYRNNEQIATHSEHRFILNHGALGDMITSLPALVHARAADRFMKLVVYVAAWQIELVRHLLAPYGEFDVRDITEVPFKYKERVEAWGDVSMSMNAPVGNNHTRNRVHMVDFAFNYLIDARPESMLERSYPTAAALGPRTIELFDGAAGYIVFPVGATSDNKLFRASVMTPVLQWALDNGYQPVLVGTKVSHTRAEMGDGVSEKLVIREQTDLVPPKVFAQCLDMREKTTLLELRDLCGHAAAVVGVDGGSLHLAGTTDVPIIFASGTTLPAHRYIARQGNPSHKVRYIGPRGLECTGCQSRWVMTRFDFRNCAYDDNLCMSKLDPQDFINGLRELGL